MALLPFQESTPGYPLFWITLTILRSTEQVFSRVFLIWDWCNIFLTPHHYFFRIAERVSLPPKQEEGTALVEAVVREGEPQGNPVGFCGLGEASLE